MKFSGEEQLVDEFPADRPWNTLHRGTLKVIFTCIPLTTALLIFSKKLNYLYSALDDKILRTFYLYKPHPLFLNGYNISSGKNSSNNPVKVDNTVTLYDITIDDRLIIYIQNSCTVFIADGKKPVRSFKAMPKSILSAGIFTEQRMKKMENPEKKVFPVGFLTLFTCLYADRDTKNFLS